MLKHVRTHEAYAGRSEDVYNEKGERLFSLHLSYTLDYSAGGDQFEEHITYVKAYFDLKGEDAKAAYQRISNEEEYKDRLRWLKTQSSKKRLKRESDPIWQERVQAARILSRHKLKASARFLIKDYLKTHSF